MKKKISAVIASAILVLSISGCNNDKEAADTTAAEASGQIGGNSFETWKDIDRKKVIAYVEGEDSAKFDITFGDFYSEYLYYLLSYNINDDMSSKYKEACEGYREDIITYITFERVFLQIAEEMGCGTSSLTEEEKAVIKENADKTLNSFISNYRTTVEAELGEGATEDDILNRCTELLVADLARSELTIDAFERWETNTFIQDKLAELITKDVVITEEAVDAMFEEYVQAAKETYESSKVSYESNDTYKWIYVPEGTRLVDQILIAFDDETQQAINDARTAGNPDEAIKIRNEAYDAEMQEKVNNIIALIESGSNFNDLQETYNEDTSNDEYAVIEGSELYVSDFTEAVFSIEKIGEIAEPAISDYGVHIILYSGDARVTDEDITEIRASMKSFLEYQEDTKIQEAAYAEWTEKYPYTIDYDTIKVTPNVTEDDLIKAE